MSGAKTIVFLFRYGAGEHVNFMPALPRLCQELHDQGWEVEHLGFRGCTEPPADLLACSRVNTLPFRVRRQSTWDKSLKAVLWILLLPWLGWRLQRRGVHTLFVDETLPLSIRALRYGYRGNLLVTIHDCFSEIYLGNRRGLRWLRAWIDRVDAASRNEVDILFPRVEAAKAFLLHQGIPEERIQVIPDSVDTTLFCPDGPEGFREAWGISPEETVVIHHGILHPNKGNLRLVRAFHRLREHLQGVRLVIIGDGPEMSPLRKILDDLQLNDQVLLTGWLPSLSNIAVALREADIGLVMRQGIHGDDFHVTSTLVHNLASGLPVLAVRLEGIASSLQEGSEGLLFDASCGQEFEEKLLMLVKDPQMRSVLSRQAREAAIERFSCERVAKAYADIVTK